MRWNGSDWTSATTAVSAGMVSDVVALTPRDAWIVGMSSSGATQTQHWDGWGWQTVAPSVSDVTLNAVDGIRGDNVWAVGYRYVEYGTAPVALHWDGLAWSEVPVAAPTEGIVRSQLYDIVVTGPRDAWAVGYYFDGDTPYDNGLLRTLVERWDGSTWSIVESPNADGNSPSELQAVTSSGRNDVWAVGDSFDGTSTHPLALHWAGSGWSVSAMPTLPPGTSLSGTYARRPDDVWGVGLQFKNGSDGNTVILRWNGVTWAAEPSPNPNSGQNALVDIAGTGRMVQTVGYATEQELSGASVIPIAASYSCTR